MAAEDRPISNTLRLRDAIIFSLFFFSGISLMYVGYFKPYGHAEFILYCAAILFVGLSYVAYSGFVAVPEDSFYFWFFMFLFFPKKPIPAYMPSLFSTGFHFSSVSGSFYYILDIFVILGLAIASIRQYRTASWQPMSARNRYLFYSFLVMAVVGIFHLFFFPSQHAIPGIPFYDSYFIAFWPLISGIVVLVACFVFLSRPQQVDVLFTMVLMACVLLLVEYGLARFTDLLPETIVYYSMDYRGAFRSAIASGDLFVGQLMILGAAVSLYFAVRNGSRICMALALLFSLLLLETYNRCSLIGLLLMLAALLPFVPRVTKTLIVGTMITVIVMPLAGPSLQKLTPDPIRTVFAPERGEVGAEVLTGQKADRAKKDATDAACAILGIEKKNEEIEKDRAPAKSETPVVMKTEFTPPVISSMSEYKAYIMEKKEQAPFAIADSKGGGMLAAESTMNRIGAMTRGLDVFLLHPVLGAGPGQLVATMSSPMTPSVIDPEILPKTAAQFYRGFSTGEHPTGPHNFFVRLMGEYGIAGLAAGLVMVGWLLYGYLSFLFKKSIAPVDQPTRLVISISYAVLLGYGAYFLFQAEPLILGLLFMLVRMSTLGDRAPSHDLIAGDR